MAAGESFANVQDLENFWKDISDSDEVRAANLLVLASDNLRQIAINSGRDLDQMIADGKVMANTVKLIVMESVKRAMLTPTDQAPISQGSMTAGPYAQSYTFANPAGDIWFKDKELKMLRLKKQRLSSVSTARTNIYSCEEDLQ